MLICIFFALSERVDPFILNFLYRPKTRYTSLYINFFQYIDTIFLQDEKEHILLASLDYYVSDLGSRGHG